MKSLFPIVVGFLLTVLVSTGCDNSSNSSTANHRKSSQPIHTPGDSVKGSELSNDERLILSVSANGFTVNGSTVVMDRTAKAEMEKLIGPMDRVVDLRESDQVGIWDDKGLRANFSKHTQVVDHFTCFFVIDADVQVSELRPRRPFNGVFKVESIAISKDTTKADLQDRVEGRVRDHSVKRLGFHIRYRTHSISFELIKDQTVLEMVGISSLGYR